MSKSSLRKKLTEANDNEEDGSKSAQPIASDLLARMKRRRERSRAEINKQTNNADETDETESPRLLNEETVNETDSTIKKLIRKPQGPKRTIGTPKRNREHIHTEADDVTGGGVVEKLVRNLAENVALEKPNKEGQVNEAFEKSDHESDKDQKSRKKSRSRSRHATSDENENEDNSSAKKPKTKTRRRGRDKENTDKTKSDQEKKSDAEEAPEVPDHSIVAIIVHQSGKLRTDINIYHPVVKVHVLDLDMDGQYVKKSNKDRNVLFYYESESRKVDYLPPIIITPFDFKQNGSIIPKWEELVVYNEKYNYLIKEHPNVLLMFEILDSLNKPTDSNETPYKHSYTQMDPNYTYQRIAWAFLKVVGSDKSLNTEKKIRLQLFYYPNSFRNRALDGLVPDIYAFYKNPTLRIKYPSTMTVTMKSIVPPKKFSPGIRSVYFLQDNLEVYANTDTDGETTNRDPTSRSKGGNATDEDSDHLLKQQDGSKQNLSVEEQNKRWLSKKSVLWSRLPGQACRIPNELMHTFNTTKNGCYSVRFSNSGTYLAMACVEDNNISPVYVFNITDGQEAKRFTGHFGLVYELSWSPLDKYIITASSDATARIYLMESKSKSAFRILPHPSFIYSAKFHPKSLEVVCTSGYDKVIRIWSLESTKEFPKSAPKFGSLLQELTGHLGYINSICFTVDGTSLFSADSTGRIFCWNTKLEDEGKSNKKQPKVEWSCKEIMEVEELKNQCINYIEMHPNQRRLLVHLRDNQLKLVDIRIQSVVQRYKGAFNFNQNLKSTITPCGTFLFSSGADTKIYCWNIDSGEQVTTASINLNYMKPARDICFHPFDNMIALCSFDTHAPVYIFKYNAEKATNDLNDIRPIIIRSPTLQTKSQTPRPDLKQSFDEQILPLKPERNDLLLRQKFTEENSRYDQFQNNLWNQINEKLDSVGPSDHSKSPRKQMIKDSSAYPAGSIILSMDSSRPEFKYRGPKEAQDVVVALYEYKAQRNDELDLSIGDEILVLVKESENWWMGELLKNKRQGYFPANYVEDKSVNPRTHDYLLRKSAAAIRAPQSFSTNDIMADMNQVFKTDKPSSSASAITNQPKSSRLISAPDEQPLNSTENQEMDIINEVPTRDRPRRKKRSDIQRRPFAAIIKSNQPVEYEDSESNF